MLVCEACQCRFIWVCADHRFGISNKLSGYLIFSLLKLKTQTVALWMPSILPLHFYSCLFLSSSLSLSLFCSSSSLLFLPPGPKPLSDLRTFHRDYFQDAGKLLCQFPITTPRTHTRVPGQHVSYHTLPGVMNILFNIHPLTQSVYMLCKCGVASALRAE